MQRRRLVAASLATAGLATLDLSRLPVALAAIAPTEGKEYLRLGTPVPVGEPGRIEVIEFFWYGCPHCRHFEDVLEPWAARLPADVRFRRVPVGFTGLQQVHQRLYFALESMGLVDRLHAKVFHRFHDEHQPLNQPDDMAAWVATQGGDPARFKAAWESFSVRTRMRQADDLAGSYDLDGVPTLAVQGRFKTGVPEAGGEVECLQVVDWLVDRVRRRA